MIVNEIEALACVDVSTAVIEQLPATSPAMRRFVLPVVPESLPPPPAIDHVALLPENVRSTCSPTPMSVRDRSDGEVATVWVLMLAVGLGDGVGGGVGGGGLFPPSPVGP
jgi:hypothetical protein